MTLGALSAGHTYSSVSSYTTLAEPDVYTASTVPQYHRLSPPSPSSLSVWTRVPFFSVPFAPGTSSVGCLGALSAISASLGAAWLLYRCPGWLYARFGVPKYRYFGGPGTPKAWLKCSKYQVFLIFRHSGSMVQK